MRVGVKLPPICDIDVGFAFIPFDQEVCNSVPLLSHLFEEVPRVTNSGCNPAQDGSVPEDRPLVALTLDDVVLSRLDGLTRQQQPTMKLATDR